MTTNLRQVRLLVLGLVIHSWAVVLAALGEVPTPDAVRSEYLKALAVLEQDYAHCSGSGVMATFKISGGKTPTAAELHAAPRSLRWFDFSTAGDRAKAVNFALPTATGGDAALDPARLQSARDLATESIRSYNSQYSFTLRRKNGSLVVESLEAKDQAGRRALGLYASMFDPIATVFRSPISTLLQRTGLQIDRVTAVGTGADGSLRLDLLSTKPRTDPRAIIHKSGWLVVVPRDRWALREYGFNMVAGSGFEFTRVGRIDYGTLADGRSKPIKVTSRDITGHFSVDPETLSPPVLPHYGEEFRYADFRFGDEPLENFTLSAYGLPEFGQTLRQVEAKRAFPWWTIGAAVGLGVLAFGLRRWAARQSARTPEPVV